MLPCHSCFIYGTWRSKEVGGVAGGGEVLKSSYRGGGGKPQMGGPIIMGELIPLDTMIEKESARSAFLKIFQIVSGKLFRRMPVGGCFGYSFQVSYDSLAKAFHIDFNPYDIA